MNVKEKLKSLPDSPGVYLLRDKGHRVIYIGKSFSLKKRVASYFQKGSFDPKIGQLIQHLADFDYIRLTSEPEALLLEVRLIKQFQPKYNQLAKDDKSYPFLKITKERFSSFTIVRDPGRFRNHHPPPHPSHKGRGGEESLFIPSPRGRGIERRGAFYFGPYTDVIGLRQAYRYIRNIFPVRRCRKKINPEKKLRPCLDFWLGRCKGPCAGKIKEKEYQRLVDSLISFLKGKYKETMQQLKELMKRAAVELNFEEAAKYRNRIEAIRRMKQSEVHPCRGSSYRTRGLDKSSPYIHLNELKKVLSLPRLPQRIEAIDISDISGDKAVGSLVSFKDGRPYKDGYRRFKIKGVSKIDDYKMMAEVVERRYREKKNLPDLLLIDGGKGHLSVVMQRLKNMKLHFPVAALAKRREAIFLPDSPSPLILKKNTFSLRLLQEIRDEAHRFAISYHKRLRRRALKESGLDEIEGIGAQRKKRLLSHFDSLAEIKKSSVEELKRLGLSEKLSKRVIEFLGKVG